MSGLRAVEILEHAQRAVPCHETMHHNGQPGSGNRNLSAQIGKLRVALDELLLAVGGAMPIMTEACSGPPGPLRDDAVARRDRLAAALQAVRS